MVGPRYQRLGQFFPYYLSEHRHPVSRALHFIGTTGFLACVAMGVASEPLWFPIAMVLTVGVGMHAVHVERTRPPFVHLGLMVLFPGVAAPVPVLTGVVLAYGGAWLGHFIFEKNRPATFSYPVMSLTCDFLMYGHMLCGRLWRSDPLRALGRELAPERTPDA